MIFSNLKLQIYLPKVLVLGWLLLSPRLALAVVDVTRDQTEQLPKIDINKEVVNQVGTFAYTTQPLFTKFNFTATLSKTTKTDPTLLYNSISEQTKDLKTQAQEPQLTLAGGTVTSFTPPENGLLVDSTATAVQILTQNKTGSLEPVAYKVKPQSKLADTNTLGINELIGRGESIFAGSPRNRRINIKIGLEKMRGVLIAPGEEFSFNKHLGPVEAEYGFVPELVIKRTGTVPELGGGLCQVSSTTWRAAMKAGLPITQRKNHSYAVQYYAPQGSDATIYPGVIDLRFINDTPGTILIWPYLRTENELVFDFYGTKDSRQVVLEKPTQYDRKSDGSMKATWIRHVTKVGVTKTDTFNSTYLPPALFHKQESFVPNPQTPPPTIGPTPVLEDTGPTTPPPPTTN